MAAAPVYFGTIKNYAVQLVNGSGVTYVTLYDVPASGGVVESIAVTSTDSVARDVTLAVTKSAVDYALCTKTIPITAGTIAATAAVDLLDLVQSPWIRVDANGNRILLLDTDCILKVKAIVAVTSPLVINFFVQAREV